MSQALNTAMSGISANQLNLNLIADNVANLNTTAYKESQMTFKDVWYQTSTTGTAPSGNLGGTNPYQIGVGTVVQSITRNFEPAAINTTGRSTDMAIEGQGFFTVMDNQGAVYLTRDGSFSLDAAGNLVNSLGYKVLGTNSSLSLQASNVPIFVPQTIEGGAYPQPADTFKDKNTNELNNSKISSGTFQIVETNAAGIVQTPITINVTAGNTVQAMVDEINEQLQDAGSAVTCSIIDGALQFDAGTNKSLEFRTGTSNFVEQTGISYVNKEGNAYKSLVLDYRVDIEPVDNLANALSLSSMAVGVDGVIEATYSNGDKLTIWQDPQDGSKLFKYITATGVEILGPEDVSVNPNLMTEENLQMQCASVTNVEGLVAMGQNLYTVGPDCGQVIYTNGDKNGVGNIRTGGLEASNVDLSRQFSNMILAQRGIEANSRVFDTASNILQTIVYLGRG